MEGQTQRARTLQTVKRELGYVPGAPVAQEQSKKKRRTDAGSTKTPSQAEQARLLLLDKQKNSRAALQRLAGIIPDILLEHAVESLVKGRAVMSVILMSMVNKQFHQCLSGDIRLWYRLYLTWRGPIQPTQPGPIRTGRGMVTLHPTIPRSLPNFRDLSPSIARLVEHNRVLAHIDKAPNGASGARVPASTDEEMRVMRTYKAIVCLTHVTRCGMCGTTRHVTKPYWHLGLRLCKCCLQDNLVSHTVLQERYFIYAFRSFPVQSDGATFADRVAGKVWFFKEHCSSRQRAEYTSNALDFHPAFGKNARVTWFFWRPHLEKVLDIPRLEREATEKREAACTLRAQMRRALILRALTTKTSWSAAERTKLPTRPVADWKTKIREKREALFHLHKMAASHDLIIKAWPRWDLRMINRLTDHEDRLSTNRTFNLAHHAQQANKTAAG